MSFEIWFSIYFHGKRKSIIYVFCEISYSKDGRVDPADSLLFHFIMATHNRILYFLAAEKFERLGFAADVCDTLVDEGCLFVESFWNGIHVHYLIYFIVE